MIKVTRITTQKNNGERFNIYIDRGNGEEYGFSVDQDVLIQFQIRKGITFSDEELSKILESDETKKAFNMSLNYLSYRMRSEKEVIDYLSGKSFPSETIHHVLERLRQNNYVNDSEFAKMFVRSRMNTSLKGPFVIKQELFRKGISEATITEALKEYPEGQQLETAIAFAVKNSSKKNSLSPNQVRTRIAQSLLSKGFAQEIIQDALSKVTIQKDEEEQNKAIKINGEKAYKRYSTKYEGWELKQKIKQYLYQRGFTMDDIEKYLVLLED